MPDTDIHDRIIAALDADASIEADSLTVTVQDGIVAVSGRVWTAEQKAEVVARVQAVSGVVAVAVDVAVGPPPEIEFKDLALARDVSAILRLHVPQATALHIQVEKGWVTVSGNVDSFFLNREVEHQIRRLDGVSGVSVMINHRADPHAAVVRDHIRKAFARDLSSIPSSLEVSVYGGKVTLTGSVNTNVERTLAVTSAGAVDGVTFVDNQLQVLWPQS
jgi:osmotically-inducible protein OsmY